MKKIFIVIVVLVVFSFVLSSCKSSEKCPAYGQANQEQSEINA